MSTRVRGSRHERDSRRVRVRTLLLFLVPLLVGGALWLSPWKDQPSFASDAEGSVAPNAWSVPLWEETLGGDEGFTPEDFARLNDPTTSNTPEDFELLGLQATQVLTADLTGRGRSAYPLYWPQAETAETPCTSIEVVAANAQELPRSSDTRWAKTLVAYRENCLLTEDPQSVMVGHVYSTKQAEGGWTPVREWQVPGSTTLTDQGATSVPEEWEVKELVSCAPIRVSLRIVAADAWSVMCQDAAREGVTLSATEGYRSPADQKALYDEAVEYYGSDEAAQHVSYSDGATCSSRHCAGMAIDVEKGPGFGWLHSVIGCSRNGSVTLGATECEGGATPVKRMQRYGFVAPHDSNPYHLESTLPTGLTTDSNSCNPTSANTAQMVASIFRCRLQNAGADEITVERVSAEAVAMARCESGWNPLAIAQNGTYQDSPDPRTGRTYTESGVFMLSRDLADNWVPGGSANSLDPVKNIHGAASIWLAQRNWSTFGCASGAGVGFSPGPAFTPGADLPAWSYEY